MTEITINIKIAPGKPVNATGKAVNEGVKTVNDGNCPEMRTAVQKRTTTYLQKY